MLIVGLWVTAIIIMLGWIVNLTDLVRSNSSAGIGPRVATAILSAVITWIMFLSVVGAISELS